MDHELGRTYEERVGRMKAERVSKWEPVGDDNHSGYEIPRTLFIYAAFDRTM
jgi:hypothetical protein